MANETKGSWQKRMNHGQRKTNSMMIQHAIKKFERPQAQQLPITSGGVAMPQKVCHWNFSQVQ